MRALRQSVKTPPVRGTREAMRSMAKPARTIAILALPGVQLLDVSGPLDVFAEANTQVGREIYRLRIVASTRPGAAQTSSRTTYRTGVRMGAILTNFRT